MTKVISNKQLEANRANSLKSTGPKSEEGKLCSKGIDIVLVSYIGFEPMTFFLKVKLV